MFTIRLDMPSHKNLPISLIKCAVIHNFQMINKPIKLITTIICSNRDKAISKQTMQMRITSIYKTKTCFPKANKYKIIPSIILTNKCQLNIQQFTMFNPSQFSILRIREIMDIHKTKALNHPSVR